MGSVNNNGSPLGDWDQLSTMTRLIHASFPTHAHSLRIGERIVVVSWTCWHKRWSWTFDGCWVRTPRFGVFPARVLLWSLKLRRCLKMYGIIYAGCQKEMILKKKTPRYYLESCSGMTSLFTENNYINLTCLIKTITIFSSSKSAIL